MNTKVDEGKLISGKEALIALANGEDVECSITGSNEWHNKTVNITPYYFIGNGVGQFEFRLKPRTITINGIEMPKPQKDSPKKGDDVFTLDFTDNVGGFTSWKCKNSINTFSREWWRTEEEIKQVVTALRFVLTGGWHEH